MIIAKLLGIHPMTDTETWKNRKMLAISHRMNIAEVLGIHSITDNVKKLDLQVYWYYYLFPEMDKGKSSVSGLQLAD